jgi:putative peptide zinc metalloprotease protein
MSTTADDSTVTPASRRLPFRMRADLVFSQRTEFGRITWVVKDPIALKYYRLSASDVFILRAIDGKIGLVELQQRFERAFVNQRTTVEHLQSYLESLYQRSLIVAETGGQGDRLRLRAEKKQRSARLGRLTNILSIRLPGVDPDRFLNGIYPYLRWIFSRWAAAAFIGLLVGASMLIALRWQAFQAKLPNMQEFFTTSNLPWLAVAIALTKVLHELGHALTCKHFGGECHEAGIMLLVFTPTLYCDVSDAWMLPSKWHRMAVASAGITVELILAAACALGWWFSTPGLLHYLCLNTMLVCGVSTILLNANPLMRLDGYYVLSDFWEQPNLWHRSRAVLSRWLSSTCLGLKLRPEGTRYPGEHRELLAIYAAASIVYRWILLATVLFFLLGMFRGYGLDIIGRGLALFSIAGVLAVPIMRIVRFVSIPGRASQFNRFRVTLSLAVVSAALAAAYLIPLPRSLVTSMVLEPRAAQRIYVSVPGTLVERFVEFGDEVRKDQVVARLRNSDIEFEITKLEGEVTRQTLRVQTLDRRRVNDARAGAELSHAREALADLQERLQKRLEDRNRLTLKAPIAGTVLPPLSRRPDASRKDTAGWTGWALDPQNGEAFLETGTLFCLIGDLRNWDAALVVEQSEIGSVKIGQEVELNLDEYPSSVFSGRLAEVGGGRVESAPIQLSSRVGGELITETDSKGEERPLETSYRARVELADVSEPMLLGFRGRGKIHIAPMTIYERLAHYLSRTFRAEL